MASRRADATSLRGKTVKTSRSNFAAPADSWIQPPSIGIGRESGNVPSSFSLGSTRTSRWPRAARSTRYACDGASALICAARTTSLFCRRTGWYRLRRIASESTTSYASFRLVRICVAVASTLA